MSTDGPHAGRYILSIVGGANDGRQVDVTSAGLTVGRSPACDLTLDDNGISRRHARFCLRDGYCYVEDLGSRNGMVVAGQRTRKRCLRSGDVIQLGSCRLSFRAEQSPLERETPPQVLEQIKELQSYAPGAQAAASAVKRKYHPLALACVPFALLAAWHWSFAIGAAAMATLALFEIVSKDMHKGKWISAIGLSFGILLGGGNAVFNMAALSARSARTRADRACEANLRRIGDALNRYADQNEGRYPRTLRELLPAYLSDDAILSCPACVSQDGQRCSYAFPGAGKQRESMLKQAVVCDRSATYHGAVSGYAVLGSGEVVRKFSESLQELVLRTETK